jgi:hypothetical protein
MHFLHIRSIAPLPSRSLDYSVAFVGSDSVVACSHHSRKELSLTVSHRHRHTELNQASFHNTSTQNTPWLCAKK